MLSSKRRIREAAAGEEALYNRLVYTGNEILAGNRSRGQLDKRAAQQKKFVQASPLVQSKY